MWFDTGTGHHALMGYLRRQTYAEWGPSPQS